MESDYKGMTRLELGPLLITTCALAEGPSSLKQGGLLTTNLYQSKDCKIISAEAYTEVDFSER